MPDETPKPRDRDGARRRAQNHFAAAEKRDSTVRQMIEHERALVDAKTAKLRALRLAKEETDRTEAAGSAAAVAPPAKRRRGAS